MFNGCHVLTDQRGHLLGLPFTCVVERRKRQHHVEPRAGDMQRETPGVHLDVRAAIARDELHADPLREGSPIHALYWVAAASRDRRSVMRDSSPRHASRSTGTRPHRYRNSSPGSPDRVAAGDVLRPGVTTVRVFSSTTDQAASPARTSTVPVLGLAVPSSSSPASIIVSTSSMPSTASASSTALGGPNCVSTSTRWTTVSSAMRRYQNPTVWSGSHHDHARSFGECAASSASNFACSSANHSTVSLPKGSSVTHSPSTGLRPSRIAITLWSYVEATCATTSRTSHGGQNGTGRSSPRGATAAIRSPSARICERYPLNSTAYAAPRFELT